MYSKALFLNVHLYGIMIAIGILCCFIVLFVFTKKKNIESRFVDFIFYDGIGAIMFGFFTAALYQGIYNYIENPSGGFSLNGGITFIGGLIGGAVFFLGVYFLLRKRYKTRLTDVLSLLPCCILIAHAFGRVGCFFAGCCYGKETSSFLGVSFPKNSLYYGYDGTPVYPTQLYEAAFLFILFGVCLYLYMKKNFQHNLSLYLVCYGIFRFLIEYLRGDDRGAFIAGLSPSQAQSLLMIAIGVGFYFVFKKVLEKRQKELKEQAESN